MLFQMRFNVLFKLFLLLTAQVGSNFVIICTNSGDCYSLIALHSTIPDSKRISPCKVKFSAAVHLCRQFILGNVSPPVLEVLLLRQLSSIRPGRNFPRGSSFRKLVSFSYREA